MLRPDRVRPSCEAGQIVKDEILRFPPFDPQSLLIIVSTFHQVNAFLKTLNLQGMFHVKHPLQPLLVEGVLHQRSRRRSEHISVAKRNEKASRRAASEERVPP